jgi:hypothetical protein
MVVDSVASWTEFGAAMDPVGPPHHTTHSPVVVGISEINPLRGELGMCGLGEGGNPRIRRPMLAGPPAQLSQICMVTAVMLSLLPPFPT